MVELHWTREAQQWLKEIFEYVAQENPVAARKLVGSIFEKAQILTTFPESGYRYPASERDVRILLYGHYRIAYLLRDSENIDILGVFHGSLDIGRYNL